MSDASFLRELFKIDQEAKQKHQDKLFKAYLDGHVTTGTGLFTLCLQDPVLYGNLVLRIQDHKKKSIETTDGQTTNSTPQIQDRSQSLRESRDFSGK